MIGNPKVDWSLAPADADAWEVTELGVAVWTQMATMAVTTIYDLGAKAGLTTSVVGDKAAPMFGWTGDWKKSYTPRL